MILGLGISEPNGLFIGFLIGFENLQTHRSVSINDSIHWSQNKDPELSSMPWHCHYPLTEVGQ